MTRIAAAAIAAEFPADGGRSFLEEVRRECEAGVKGLQAFMDGFAGIDIYTEDEWAQLDCILERAEGFRTGLETGLAAADELRKEAPDD